MNSKNRKDAKAPLAALARQGLGPLTSDEFLGGRVRLFQLEKGYRAGMDAVLLAAAVPAKAGDRALDLGAATAAVSLCLAARCPGVGVDGIEIQDHLVALAAANIALNGLADRVKIRHGSITENPHDIPENGYDHVVANPPYLEGAQAVAPPSETKGIAYVGGEAGLAEWVRFALSRVRNKGTVTFIFRADRMPDLCHHLYGRAGELVLFPLWPRTGQPAKRVIIQARKGLHGAATIAPGLVLHGAGERYTKDAEAVLRKGAAIDLAVYHRAKGP